MISSKHSLAVTIIAFLVVLLMGTSCSQLTRIKAQIAGTVYVDGRPQAFGTVQAYKDGALISQERCTQSGHYQLKDLDPGEYTIVFLNARGAPIGGETIVDVRLGRFEQVDLQLSQSDTVPVN
jgi:hypothetical protein